MPDISSLTYLKVMLVAQPHLLLFYDQLLSMITQANAPIDLRSSIKVLLTALSTAIVGNYL